MTKLEKWLNEELGRTAGQNLNDLHTRDREELVEMARNRGNKSIREIVNEWRMT